ncbi:MAG TPA: DUF935 family protein [Gemmatimonadaceae bacterium]|nr:DUF935 family protein [Gemmatimonadaceae bacterium]
MATTAADNEAVTLPPPNATAQQSYSGTPRLPDGRTHPDEYVNELRNPLKRMEKFEEMGASDDAVHTAIDSRRQMINAANWTLASEDKTPRGQEILQFVEDNLYPHLDNLIRWLGGGALQYGFGAVEPVYAWGDSPLVASISRGKVVRATAKSGQRRIYLAKVAHIRQRSVETFNISETGDLREIWQYVYNGVRFARVKIPAEKILKWTYNQQGDDHWGVPPTRHCYKAWTFKTQLERLNILSFDRFGVGVPVAEEGEGWTDAERTRLAAFLKAFRSGDSAYVIHPNGGGISILSGDGKMTMSGLEWVKAYNVAIATAYLTQQDQVAGQVHGSRATVQTFFEHLEGIVQADCEDLANIVNNGLIVPLVLWNFGPQDAYPMFAPSQRVRAGSGVGQIIQQLISAGAIHVRPEDEAFLRDIVGLPAVAIETLRQDQAQRDAQAAQIANAKPGDTNPAHPGTNPADRGTNPGNRAPAAPATEPRPKVAATRALSSTDPAPAGTPDPAQPGQTSYRTAAFTAWEYAILRPDVLTRDLDLQTSRLAAEAHDVLRAIDDELARQVTALAAAGSAALSGGVKAIAVPASLHQQLVAALLAGAQRARDYGAQAVRNEIERQLAPQGIGPQRGYSRLTRALASTDAPPAGSLEEQRLRAEVEGAAADEIDRREQSARNAALTVLAQAAGAAGSVLASVASAATKSALVGLSTGRTAQNIEGVVNVGFGIGRVEEADAIHEAATGGNGAGGRDNRSGLRDASGQPIDIVAMVYSAVMDLGTCDECAKWDGAEFPIDYPQDHTGVQCPNPRCAGGYDQCRCVWIYITNLESVPLVPAAKGPESARRVP